jgi:hypothetical protein
VCWFKSVNVYSIPACDIGGTIDNVHITAYGGSAHMVLTHLPLPLGAAKAGRNHLNE